MITSNGESIGFSYDKSVIIGSMVKNTVKWDNLIWNCPWS